MVSYSSVNPEQRVLARRKDEKRDFKAEWQTGHGAVLRDGKMLGKWEVAAGGHWGLLVWSSWKWKRGWITEERSRETGQVWRRRLTEEEAGAAEGSSRKQRVWSFRADAHTTSWTSLELLSGLPPPDSDQPWGIREATSFPWNTFVSIKVSRFKTDMFYQRPYFK